YMWFATNSGVSCFDGYSFINYTVNDGLTENSILELFEDTKGRIWFIPFDCKLCYFENGVIHHYKYNGLIKDSLGTMARYRNYSLDVDSLENIVFGYAYGTCKLDSVGTLKLEKKIRSDRRGVVLQVDRGKFKKEPKSNYIFFDFNDFYQKTGEVLSDTTYLNFSIDQRKFFGGLYLSIYNDSGIYVVASDNILLSTSDFQEWSVKVFDHRIAFLEMINNMLYVGVLEEGLFQCNINDGLTNFKNYLAEYSVTSVVLDHQGSLWMTTLEEGVYYFPSDKILTYTSSGVYSNKVKHLVNYRGGIFGVTADGDLIDPVQDEVVIRIPAEYITCVEYKERTSALMFGGRYLFEYKDDSISILGNNNPCYDLTTNDVFMAKCLLFQNDTTWVGASGNLFRIENEMVKYGSWCNDDFLIKVESLCPSNTGGIWLGTPNGLWKYNDEKYLYYGDSSLLLSSRIKDFAVSALDSTIIIATSGSGLLLYKDSSISQISVDNGLISNSVHKVIEKDSTIWIATNLGLNEIVFHNGDFLNYSVFAYTVNDGLPDNKINDILIKDELIYVATDKGVSFFDFNKVKQNVALIPTYITGVEVMDRKVGINQEMKLAYNQNFISLSFLGVSFHDHHKYRYRLIGLSEEWNSTYATYIKYASLSSGDYTFQVCSQNKSGEWSPPAVFEFTILKPFWNTISFKIFIVLIILIVFISILKYKTNIVKNENQLREDVIILRQKALAKQVDPHFIYNSLNSIQSFILKNENIVAVKYLAKFSKLMRKVLHNSTESYVSIEEEIQAITLYLELERVRFDEKFDFQIKIDPKLHSEISFIPSFFIQPFVENAIWHGLMNLQRAGEVSVVIEKNEDDVKIIIQDNGVGREKAQSIKKYKVKGHTSMGVDISMQRLELVNRLHHTNYQLIIEDLKSEKGIPMGTKVSFNLPYFITDN
ncbi:MAG: histidine kinase, partial [Bacteroidales bacterium]|nr:histidine kinase [Bacteroidales bacterium]